MLTRISLCIVFVYINQQMDEAAAKGQLDVDYLFDHFEQFCEVKFEQSNYKVKQPTIIRNLNHMFDQVAPNRAKERLPKSNSRSKSRIRNKQTVNEEQADDSSKQKQ